MKKLIIASALIVSTALVGCAGTGGKKDFSQSVYLRGSFAWWDALPEYKLQKVGPDHYMAKVELKADGQPWEFKFGDAGWTGGTNCGYLTEEDKVVEVGKTVKANCSSIFENFRFTPTESAMYEMHLDNSGEVPLVSVKKAQ